MILHVAHTTAWCPLLNTQDLSTLDVQVPQHNGRTFIPQLCQIVEPKRCDLSVALTALVAARPAALKPTKARLRRVDAQGDRAGREKRVDDASAQAVDLQASRR